MEETDEIKKRVVRHPDSVDLYIKRIPKKVRDAFVEFANKEFVGDYGMCLKYILDEFLIQGERFSMILMALDEHEQRLLNLESGNKKEESKAIKGIREHLKKRKDSEGKEKCQE